MTLKRSIINPRYFEDDRTNNIVVLSGSNPWANFQNWGTEHRAIDFNAYMDWMQHEGHNHTRLWVTDTAWSGGSEGASCEPQPFVRTGPGNALYGGLKFNLTNLNQTYFDELFTKVKKAEDSDIYVTVMLFDVWGAGSYGNSAEWLGCPFHKNNNINGINGDPDGNGIGNIHTLQIPSITQIQKAYVQKVIDTVNNLDNVLYEIINEGSDKAFQYHFIDFVRNYESTKPKQHPIGINGLTNNYDSQDDLFASSADFISPFSSGTTGLYLVNPPVSDGRKVILIDTDHIENVRVMDNAWTTTKWIWRCFCRGHNPNHLDRITELTGEGDRPGDDNARKAMKHILNYSMRLQMEQIMPTSNYSDCSTGYCLYNPGKQYLFYQPNSGTFTVKVIPGKYYYEWFNPTTRLVDSNGTTTLPASPTFTPPFNEHAVLFLNNTNYCPPLKIKFTITKIQL